MFVFVFGVGCCLGLVCVLFFCVLFLVKFVLFVLSIFGVLGGHSLFADFCFFRVFLGLGGCLGFWGVVFFQGVRFWFCSQPIGFIVFV
jgi:hypothetical protein